MVVWCGVQVVMDFHAHLNMNEVIGLLAGECDEDRRLIRQAIFCPHEFYDTPARMVPVSSRWLTSGCSHVCACWPFVLIAFGA